MLIVYVAVALLALAVCVLFAMVGELATRVLAPEEIRPVQLPAAEPIETVPLGGAVDTVPGPLAGGSGPAPAPDDFGVVVLTTICSSCSSFAREFVQSGKAAKLPAPLYLLISAPNLEEARRFHAETGLSRLEHLTVVYDELGAWCRDALALNVAPSFVRVVKGELHGAWRLQSFRDIPVLWDRDQAARSRQSVVEERSKLHVHHG